MTLVKATTYHAIMAWNCCAWSCLFSKGRELKILQDFSNSQDEGKGQLALPCWSMSAPIRPYLTVFFLQGCHKVVLSQAQKCFVVTKLALPQVIKNLNGLFSTLK